jgi:hypothetical protein
VAVKNIICLPLSFNTAPASLILGRKSGRLCNTVYRIKQQLPLPQYVEQILIRRTRS